MSYFAGDNRYMSIRDRASQQQRDEEARVAALKKYAGSIVLADISAGMEDSVAAKRARAQREEIAHEEMMERTTRTVSLATASAHFCAVWRASDTRALASCLLIMLESLQALAIFAAVCGSR